MDRDTINGTQDDFGPVVSPASFQGDHESVSWLAVGAELVALIAGGALLVVAWSTPESALPWAAFVGYLLTPLATAIFFARTLSAHRRKAASDSYDMRAGRHTVRVGIVIALLGFAIGVPLIFRCALWASLLPMFNGGAT